MEQCIFVFSSSVYDDLVARGVIVPAKEVPPPTVPMDYSWARVSSFFRFCYITLHYNVM